MARGEWNCEKELSWSGFISVWLMIMIYDLFYVFMGGGGVFPLFERNVMDQIRHLVCPFSGMQCKLKCFLKVQ